MLTVTIGKLWEKTYLTPQGTMENTCSKTAGEFILSDVGTKHDYKLAKLKWHTYKVSPP